MYLIAPTPSINLISLGLSGRDNSNFPTLHPSHSPTISPILSELDPLDADIGEIKLDLLKDQSCSWRELECSHCLETLRIQNGDLLTKDNSIEDGCQCAGGKGLQIKQSLVIDTSNNLSKLTFGVTDDSIITLNVEQWSYSGNNSINSLCVLRYYVNRHSFLNVSAKNILQLTFDLVGDKDDDELILRLLKNYFTNDSAVKDEMEELMVSIEDECVSVLINTANAQNARQLEADLKVYRFKNEVVYIPLS